MDGRIGRRQVLSPSQKIPLTLVTTSFDTTSEYALASDQFQVSTTPLPRFSTPTIAASSGLASLLQNPFARVAILGLGAVPAVLVGLSPANVDASPVNSSAEADSSLVAAASFAADAQPVLRVGDRGEAVERLQSRLAELGYPSGATRGHFDDTVRSSVASYQAHRGLDDDGVVGRLTWTALAGLNVRNPVSTAVSDPTPRANVRVEASNAALVSAASWSPASQPVVQIGSRGEAVVRLQDRLNRLGYDAGTSDGAFGRKTRAAMVEYQLDQNLPLSSRVTAAMWQRLAQAQPPRAAPPTHTPAGNALREVYPPRAAETRALFREAARLAGVPVSWADSSGLHNILERESQGRVGVPNFTYGSVRNDSSRYREVHAELMLGIRSARSSATGIGQLLLDNVEAYYPSGRQGIGNPLEEAVGMLKYIEARYGNPDAAWRAYNRHHQGY